MQAVVTERDTDGRPVLRLVVADLQLKPLEQRAQQRFGRRSQPFGREQGQQLQQVHRLLISIGPLAQNGAQLGQPGLLFAVQFPKSSRDLLEQGSARIIALLDRANQTRLAALEVGNGSLERMDPRFPGRDLVTGDLGGRSWASRARRWGLNRRRAKYSSTPSSSTSPRTRTLVGCSGCRSAATCRPTLRGGSQA